MADENRGEFQHNAWVSVETIAAVIGAFERGEIELEQPPTTEKGHTERRFMVYRAVNHTVSRRSLGSRRCVGLVWRRDPVAIPEAKAPAEDKDAARDVGGKSCFTER
ncbi:MAG: hypothetical protein GEU82_18505 [Luteitalea sp.]|nr:hypothetical protein [Luteitalea sp.]